jgi:flagellar motility protein MotE (MotC chaperone)
MAKKKEVDDNIEKKKSGGVLFTTLVIIGILIAWIILFIVIIRSDVGGIGTSLRPALKDVPVINWILPPVSEEQVAFEENYPYQDLKEAVGVIKQLEVQIDTLTKERDDAATQIADLQAEVERLKVFEDQQLAFEERVKAFDKNVVFNDKAPSIEEYKAYYEEINPTTAEEIYRLVLEQLQYDESIIEKANIVKTMKPSQAAAVLQEMTADMEWVAKVLLSMKIDECAAIMDKMDQLYVAKIFKKMADMDEEKYNAIVQSLQ